MKKPKIHYRHDRQLLQTKSNSPDTKFLAGHGHTQSSHHFKIPPTINTISINPTKFKQPVKLPLLLSSPKGIDNLEQVRSLSPMSVSACSSRSSPRELIMHIRSLAPKGLPKIETESLKPSPRKNKQQQSLTLVEKAEVSPYTQQIHLTSGLRSPIRDDLYQLDIPVNICETFASSPSSQRLPIIESAKSPSFSLNKGRKKKRVNKQRAALRNLTSSETLIPMKMAKDLHIEPAAAIYNSAEDIIKELLVEGYEVDENAFNISRTNHAKQAVPPDRSNVYSLNKKKPIIKKIKNSQIKYASLITDKVDTALLPAKIEKEHNVGNPQEDSQGKNKEILVSKLRKIVTIAPFMEMQEGNNLSKSVRVNIRSPRK